jgi:molybdopterin-guanine dinucleotide biosynthesis protein A
MKDEAQPPNWTQVPPLIAGIFVGGQARRFGGFPKGLLPGPRGPSLVDALAELLRSLGIPCVLVGRHPAYADCGLPTLDDERLGIGPLGGLLALLNRAGPSEVLALACDLPFVTLPLVARLARAHPGASAVAPCREGRWEPLFARYAALAALPIARRRANERVYSLQGLLGELAAVPLRLDAEETPLLDDWEPRCRR